MPALILMNIGFNKDDVLQFRFNEPHSVLPYSRIQNSLEFVGACLGHQVGGVHERFERACVGPPAFQDIPDRKSTRLNSSHGYISYAVFCLKKKKKKNISTRNKDHTSDSCTIAT